MNQARKEAASSLPEVIADLMELLALVDASNSAILVLDGVTRGGAAAVQREIIGCLLTPGICSPRLQELSWKLRKELGALGYVDDVGASVLAKLRDVLDKEIEAAESRDAAVMQAVATNFINGGGAPS